MNCKHLSSLLLLLTNILERYAGFKTKKKSYVAICTEGTVVNNTAKIFCVHLQIEFVTSLPKTVSGKIRRVELRQLEEAKKGLKKNEK